MPSRAEQIRGECGKPSNDKATGAGASTSAPVPVQATEKAELVTVAIVVFVARALQSDLVLRLGTLLRLRQFGRRACALRLLFRGGTTNRVNHGFVIG